MGYNNELSGRIVLDLETCPDPAVADLLDPIRVPANYKDPAKIAAYAEEKRGDILARAGLEPDLCNIVAIGFTRHPDSGDVMGFTRADATEEQLIETLWNAIGRNRIIGFNVLSFDLPVLIRRSQLLGVRFFMPNVDRYRTPHVDLLERLSFNGKLTYRSLAFYCRRFGIPCDDQSTGSDMAALVMAGNWPAIKAHVMADVNKTAALATRLGMIEAMA